MLKGLPGNIKHRFYSHFPFPPSNIPSFREELPSMGRNYTGTPMPWRELGERNFKERPSPKLKKQIFLSRITKFTTNLPFISNIELGKLKGTSQILKETNSWLTRAASCFYAPRSVSAASDFGKFEMTPANWLMQDSQSLSVLWTSHREAVSILDGIHN